MEYTDYPRSITLKSAQQFVDYLKEGWTTAFSDASVTNMRYTEGADKSIAQFEGSGTNDGTLGPLPATGRTMSMPFCEIIDLPTAPAGWLAGSCTTTRSRCSSSSATCRPRGSK